MPELFEKVKPSVHVKSPKKCPFCPGDPEPTWTSYKGDTNNSTTLADIMKQPDTLPSKQGGARPKDGKDGRQKKAKKRPYPDPPYSNRKYGEYGFQAHHAISGNEILKGEPVEDYFKAAAVIKTDTGYSVNNSDNGVWLPAYPKRYHGKWGKKGNMKDDTKQRIMEMAMRARKGQAHIGGHDIDAQDPSNKIHRSYPKVGKAKLQKIVDYIELWAAKCRQCKGKDPAKGEYDPPFKINQYMDNVSDSLRKGLTKHPKNWRYFLSEYAREYHKKLCGCSAAKDCEW
jgi:hypothetical protein